MARLTLRSRPDYLKVHRPDTNEKQVSGPPSFTFSNPRHYALNRELVIQRKLRQQRNRALAEEAQITAHADHAIKTKIDQRTAIETVARELLFGLALRTVVRAIAVGIGDCFGVLLDRASERV